MYHVVYKSTIKHLEDEVEQYMAMGYVLAGPLVIEYVVHSYGLQPTTVYLQAMRKLYTPTV